MATVAPAISTCDMIHPPNTSPLAFTSAGIVTTRRVAVLFEGKLMGILPVEEAELEEIGLMMAGVKRAGEQAS